MKITVELRSLIMRIAIIAAATFGAGVFISLSAAQFIISVITDPQARVETAIIELLSELGLGSSPNGVPSHRIRRELVRGS
jgi:hypothetical protein